MSDYNHELGASGELEATQFLLQKDYRLLARNLKTRYGEVDILMADGPTLVIVEVKTKTNLLYGQPLEMITKAKKCKLTTLALHLATRYNKIDYRIDVVAIDRSTRPTRIEHIIAI